MMEKKTKPKPNRQKKTVFWNLYPSTQHENQNGRVLILLICSLFHCFQVSSYNIPYFSVCMCVCVCLRVSVVRKIVAVFSKQEDMDRILFQQPK